MPDATTTAVRRRAARACINSLTPEGCLTTSQAAELLDVPYATLLRWWRSWYPDAPLVPGYGKGLAFLSPVDLMVARAWLAITDATPGDAQHSRWACRSAERAIRRDPKPWLLLTEHSARTYPTAADATAEWVASRALAGRVIHVGEGPCC